MEHHARPAADAAATPLGVADFALLRTAMLPEARKSDTWVDLEVGDPGQYEAMIAYLARLAADPILTEAIAVASPSLARTLSRLEAGAVERSNRLKLAEVRRAVLAVTKYLLRMSTRATPFGLMAGVALAEFGESASVRWGPGHRKAVRPDRAWLLGLVADWETIPAVLSGLRLVANPLCAVEGDRLVLDYHVEGEPDRRRRRRVSVRHTPAVRAVIELTHRPVPVAGLLAHLRSRFPAQAADRAEEMVGHLVRQGILLTDLRPPATEPDPLRHTLERLAPALDGNRSESLSRVVERVRAYQATPLGGGSAHWQALSEAMRALRAADNLVQVDLRLDVDLRLPRVVAEEIEQTARLLWQVRPPVAAPASIRQYHADFLERYGTERLVPLLELLDPHRGMGAPAGYQFPASPRALRPEPPTEHARNALLLEIAQTASPGRPEVVLDEALMSRLNDGSPGEPPTSFELYLQLLADSPASVEAGNFQLAIVPDSGSAPAGATFGRFAYLLGQARNRLESLAHEAVHHDSELPVQLGFPAVHSRGANVSQVAALLPYRLPVGEFADPQAPNVIDVADLFVGADPDRLYLVSESLLREVRATSFHKLNVHSHATNVARFIAELADWSAARTPVWSWGAANALPFLPRVRHGRTTLYPARWRIPRDLADSDLDDRAWLERLGHWQDRWRVPGQVHLSSHSQRIELNLAVPLHLQLLRQELRRGGDPNLYELPGQGGSSFEWLNGHVCELVVPVRTGREPPARPAAARPAPRRDRRPAHLPGGEWLYLKLYASAERHDRLLAEDLPVLLAGLPPEVDRWFFLRYHDPEPHLRLRFHSDRPARLAEWLGAVHSWASGLHRQSRFRRLVIDTYEPELDRYGGPQPALAAERVFCADSNSVLAQLRLRSGQLTSLPDELLAAANYLDLLQQFGAPGDGADWQSWLLAQFPKQHTMKRALRDHAIALLDPAGSWSALRAVTGGEALLRSWHERAGAVAAYGRAVRRAGAHGQLWSSPDVALNSILHMHHNRLIGTDRQHEELSYAVARVVVQAHADRARAQQRSAQPTGRPA